MTDDSCPACGQPILYVISEATGRPISLDPEPNEGGRVIILGDPPRARVLPPAVPGPAGHRFALHVQMCPEIKRGG